VRVLYVVNASFEAPFCVVSRHTSSACTEVGVVVGAVEDIGDAGCCRNSSEETCHVISRLNIVLHYFQYER